MLLSVGFASFLGIIVAILVIAMCSHADDRKKEKKEHKKRRVSSSDEKVFSDPLEELSENMTFNVIQKSNKDRRRELAKANPPPAAPSSTPKSVSRDRSKVEKSKHVSSESSSYDSSSV
jgi:FtsZ-interacting cell division protein ZipA